MAPLYGSSKISRTSNSRNSSSSNNSNNNNSNFEGSGLAGPPVTYGTFLLTISQHPHPPVKRRSSACNKSVNVRKETSFQWRENKAKIYQQFHSFTLLVYRILLFEACIFCLPLVRESDVVNNCHVFVTS